MTYVGLGPMRGQRVSQEDALSTAMKNCGIALENPAAPETDEFLEQLVEWYFSGDWLEEDEDNEA